MTGTTGTGGGRTVCCFLCRRYRTAEKMDGLRCADRETCLRVATRAQGPTPAQEEAVRLGRREQRR